MKKEKIKTKYIRINLLFMLIFILVSIIFLQHFVLSQSTNQEIKESDKTSWDNVNSGNIAQINSWSSGNKNNFIEYITKLEDTKITWETFEDIMKKSSDDIRKSISDKIINKYSGSDLGYFLNKWLYNKDSSVDGIKKFLGDLDNSNKRVDYITKIKDVIYDNSGNGLSKENKEKLVNLFNEGSLALRKNANEASAREILYAKLTGLKDPNKVKIGTNFKIGYNKNNGNFELKYSFGGKDAVKLSYNSAGKDGETGFPKTLEGITADGKNLALNSIVNGAPHTLNFDEKFLNSENQVLFKKNGETTITIGSKSFSSNPFTSYEKTPAVGTFSISNAGNPVFTGINIGLITGNEISYAPQGVQTPMSVELIDAGRGKTIQVSTNSWTRLSMDPNYNVYASADDRSWTNSLAFQTGSTPVALLGFGKADTNTGNMGAIAVIIQKDTGNNLIFIKGNVGDIKVYSSESLQKRGELIALSNPQGTEIWVDSQLQNKFTVRNINTGNDVFVMHGSKETDEDDEEDGTPTASYPHINPAVSTKTLPQLRTGSVCGPKGCGR